MLVGAYTKFTFFHSSFGFGVRVQLRNKCIIIDYSLFSDQMIAFSIKKALLSQSILQCETRGFQTYTVFQKPLCSHVENNDKDLVSSFISDVPYADVSKVFFKHTF